MPVPLNAILAHYESVLNDLQRGISAAQAAQGSALLAACASVLFFAAIFIPAARYGIPRWYPPLALPVAAVYGRKYLQQRRTAFQKSRLSAFYSRGVQRLKGTWAGGGESGEQFRIAGHLYERDLNVLGSGSLFELLCTARTQLGRAKLAEYLLQLPRVEESQARQDAVKELAPISRLREAVHLLGRYGFEGTEWGALNDWLTAAPIRSTRPMRTLMATSGILLAILLLAIFTGALSIVAAAPALIVLAAAQLLFAAVWARRTRLVLDRVRRFGTDIGILREGLQLLKDERFASRKLGSLAAATGDESVAAIRRLERLVNGVYDCDKGWLYGVSRLLLAPVQIALAIEQWKWRHGRNLQVWAEAWAEFEALNCLGCYAYEHPGDVFPLLSGGRAFLTAEGLGHPLLREDQCVRNDVHLGETRRFYLVSGSNMAGKSTFLRTIGSNAVLAAIGAPIRARSGALSGFSVCASISQVDSLLEGKSRFLAEVERVRETVRCTWGNKPVLFLIDEIFSGTNSADRAIAAEAVVRELVSGGAVGALSTHDLALTPIAAEPDFAGENVHMASNGLGDPLCFDYLVKPGICAESNATSILKLAGIAAG